MDTNLVTNVKSFGQHFVTAQTHGNEESPQLHTSGLLQVEAAVEGVFRRESVLHRVGKSFVVCRRARMVALLAMWPEGEADIKVELRSGKRIRSVTGTTGQVIRCPLKTTCERLDCRC